MLENGIFKLMPDNLKDLMNFTMNNVEEANTGTDIVMLRIVEEDMELEVLKQPYPITELPNWILGIVMNLGELM